MEKSRQELIDFHAYGFCNIFAIQASLLKNLRCEAIIRYSTEEDEIGEGYPMLIHAYCKINESLAFDAYGVRSIESIYRDYGEPDGYIYHLVEDAFEYLKAKSTSACFGELEVWQINAWTLPLIKSYLI